MFIVKIKYPSLGHKISHRVKAVASLCPVKGQSKINLLDRYSNIFNWICQICITIDTIGNVTTDKSVVIATVSDDSA